LGASGAENAGEGGSAGGEEPPAVPLGVGAWNVRATVTSTGDLPGECAELRFVLGIVQREAGLTVEMGRDGDGDAIRLLGPATDGSLSIEARDEYERAHLPSRADCDPISLELVNLRLERRGDRLIGSGEGVLVFDGGDTTDSADATFELVGTLDDIAPKLTVPSESLNPLDGIRIIASEPLAAVDVQLEGEPSLVLDYWLTATSLYSWQVLPFAGQWRITGSAGDLAGNPLPLGQTLRTVADPGAFAVDGFEGELAARLTGEAGPITAADGLPIPAGTRALFVPRGSSATLRLERSGSESELVFTLIELIDPIDGSAVGESYQSAQVGVVGQRGAEIEWTTAGAQPLEHPKWSLASATLVVRKQLVGAGKDVIVRFEPDDYGMTFTGKENALIIDDLRLE
jgi:hypothetical protein